MRVRVLLLAGLLHATCAQIKVTPTLTLLATPAPTPMTTVTPESTTPRPTPSPTPSSTPSTTKTDDVTTTLSPTTTAPATPEPGDITTKPPVITTTTTSTKPTTTNTRPTTTHSTSSTEAPTTTTSTQPPTPTIIIEPKVDTPITTYIAIAGGSVLAIGLLALLVVVLRRRQAAEEDEENNHRNITPREYYSEQSSNPHHNHTGGSVTSRKHLGSAQDTTSTPSTMPQSVDYLGASSRVSNPRSGNNAQHSRSSNSHTGGHPLGQYSTTGEVNEIAGYDIRFDKSMSNFRVANDEIIMGDLVASGGFGVIYRGVFAGEEIAIKKCLPDKVNNHAAMESFMLEIKLMSKLDHPNIVRFVGVAWTTLVQLKMLTEYMPRGNVRMLLQDVKKNGRSLPWVVSSATRDMPSRLRIAANVAEALVYLHLNDPPIIHRDLKSSNVLLSEDFEAKLTDFGTSRELSDEHTMTAEIGTLAWIAPEIMLGGHYTERADIYSFGVILNELDLCDLPYSNVTDARGAAISHTRLGVLVAQGKVAPQFSPQCPPWVQQMGGECLRFDPTQRPTAMQVAYRLRRSIADAK
ncbi:TKL protein kinase [Aphanomyces invadans]|uniref:TKL protein kinase n=1 Tax=Aphanomyces invadans TaxID=157072 RepID=A0A024UAN8_9STRA|nr:TKL protein kinase [Aphanomyces invadans]ETW03280.1 TKL protein kinase [Aphanomyces invadans]|eukprot:XP_008867509.1 TKL protein kinase [Aphanomyces invadans]